MVGVPATICISRQRKFRGNKIDALSLEFDCFTPESSLSSGGLITGKGEHPAGILKRKFEGNGQGSIL
jgi:hypothetical protein